ncbi:MAG: U3 snoRNP protein [Pleopsidium flavum]|nr:MAG: U3 snoRNP protein [Pleopsidium flavum]
MSSGVKMKPSKVVKSGTASTRNHRFESFTQRIAKLKIDPVRRVRRLNLEDEDLSATASYFKTSLEQWIDLNLSENFADFARSARPLCENLPQLLHYRERVMDLIAEYIGKKDALSLEPLLSLLGHFAHDLGVHFEPHFLKAVTLVASVAAKHPDVEVIEWGFTCLAWLFKYLSRLLVPDIRPLYDILVPLLGKENQKFFVVRFAAEALSFLVRKAGAMYYKNKSPLENIVRHSFEDLRKTAQTRDVQSYQRGLMTLFAGAVKGVKRGSHSSGGAVIRSLLDNILEENKCRHQWAEDIVYGVLVNVIHHSDADGFKGIMEVVLEGVQTVSLHPRTETLAFGGRLLFIMAGVRKGSRIQYWQPMLEQLEQLLMATTASSLSTVDDAAIQILSAAAVILQSSPMDVLIPHLRGIMAAVTDERLKEHFLAFCNYFAQIGRERFMDLLLPHLQR